MPGIGCGGKAIGTFNGLAAIRLISSSMAFMRLK